MKVLVARQQKEEETCKEQEEVQHLRDFPDSRLVAVHVQKEMMGINYGQYAPQVLPSVV